jgi:hypothetical protein
MTMTTGSAAIEDLKPGALVRLALHNSKGQNEIETRFVGFAQENEYLRARFQEDGSAFVWNGRLDGNRWLYGVNEDEYLSVIEILKQGNEGYIFDKHLSKISARRDSNAQGYGARDQHPRKRARAGRIPRD